MHLKINQTSNYIVLPRFTDDEASGIEYQQRILKVVNHLVSELTTQITSIYRDNKSQITFDASPAVLINQAIERIIKKYAKILNDNSNDWASYFVDQVDLFGQREFSKFMLEKGITVKMDKRTRQMLLKQRAAVLENVQLISNITEQTQTQLQGDVMRAMSEGRNLSYLEQKIYERGIQCKKRVKFIARDQLNKITSTLNTQRSIDAGFDQAVWLHSHGGKEPRQSHVQANGKIYDMNKGCLIDGEYIYPSQLPNCRCNFMIALKVKNT
jgi:uncharacterized protein with gpF-like domain